MFGPEFITCYDAEAAKSPTLQKRPAVAKLMRDNMLAIIATDASICDKVEQYSDCCNEIYSIRCEPKRMPVETDAHYMERSQMFATNYSLYHRCFQPFYIALLKDAQNLEPVTEDGTPNTKQNEINKIHKAIENDKTRRYFIYDQKYFERFHFGF